VFEKLGMQPPQPGLAQRIKASGLDGAYAFFYDEILSFLTKDDGGATVAPETSSASAYDLYEVASNAWTSS